MKTLTPDSKAAYSEPIGFIGLGAMGAPMARHLASLGYSLLVNDVNARAVQSVVDCGARAVPSAKAIASQAKLVFTCLPSFDALRTVALGDDGLHAGEAIKTYVDLSTTGAEFARELASALGERGIMMMDSPITGSVTTAGNGKLGIMCSGPRAAFDHAAPVMRDLASAMVLYLGEQNGRAQTLKLLNNLQSATGMAATCEAFVFGVKAGLDAETMLEIFNAGEGSCNATRNKFARSVLPRSFDYGARMAITAKDISLAVEEAGDLGVPVWIAQSVQQIWKYAVSQGAADKDGTALITYLEPWAGVEVRGRTGTASAPRLTPAASRKTEEYVVLCDAAMRPSLAKRLGGQGWSVGGAADRVANRTACSLVDVPPGSDPTDVLASLTRRESQSRTIINACLMGSTRAVELASALSGQGDRYLDALLTGTGHETESGGAAVLVSGTNELFEEAKPLLEAMGGRVFHVAEQPGAAQVMQQINGSLSATLLAAACESYVTGAKAGLDALTMKKILGIETGRTAASSRIIPEQVATRRFDHGKRIEDAYRELSLASDEARRLGVTPWILDKTRLLYGLAAQLGNPHDDVTRLITHYESWAKVEVTCEATDAAAVGGSTPSLV